MRKRELIKQSKLLKIKTKILLNFFNKKYGLKFGEFNNTTGTERFNQPRLVMGFIILFRYLPQQIIYKMYNTILFSISFFSINLFHIWLGRRRSARKSGISRTKRKSGLLPTFCCQPTKFVFFSFHHFLLRFFTF